MDEKQEKQKKNKSKQTVQTHVGTGEWTRAGRAAITTLFTATTREGKLRAWQQAYRTTRREAVRGDKTWRHERPLPATPGE